MTDTTAAEQPAPVVVVEPGAVTATVALDAGNRLNIRSGPGANYAVLDKASAGETLNVTGRSEDGSWLRISRANLPDSEGWVAAAFMNAGNARADAPVAESKAAPAAPAAVAAPVAAPAAPAAAPVATADGAALPTATSTPPAAQPSTIKGSPSGLSGSLAFMDGRNNIYIYELATGAVRWLTNGYDPAISPDGTKVTFYRGGGADNGIWVVNMDGTDARKIHGGGEFMRSPKWSPDGSRIVFSRMTGTWKCFDLDFLGCLSMKQIIERFGSMIPKAFIRKALGIHNEDRLEFPDWGLTSIKADGSDFRDVAAMSSAVAPDWNEDGIVYQSSTSIETTKDKEGAETHAVLQENWDHDPDWQPGGGRIIFQSKEGSHWENLQHGSGGRRPLRPDTPGHHAGGRDALQRGASLEPGRPADRLREQPPAGQRAWPLAAVGDGRRRRQSTPFAHRHHPGLLLCRRADGQLEPVEARGEGRGALIAAAFHCSLCPSVEWTVT